MVFNPNPAHNAIILRSDFAVRNFTLNGGGQFSQIGTAAGGAVTLTIHGDLIHEGTGSNVIFRGSTGSSAPVAVETIQRNTHAGFDAMVEAHRAWWHDFYQRSFLSIPDPRMESFYWIQLHKFAAAAHEGGPAVDLLGPWFKLTIWPGMWWNTNVQKSYWLPVMANHLDLSGTLIQKMDDYWEGLLNRFHRTPSQGDLAWVLHNYWLHYRHQGDWNALAENWLPKAAAVLEGYTSLLEEGSDGRLHLKPMGSSEYRGFERFRNTNYNLALLRWLVRSVNQVSEHTGEGAGLAAEWTKTVERLIDPPVDEHGFMIGSDQSVDEIQRHHSHLIGYYPLFILDDDDPEMYALLRHSTYHWLGITNPDGRRDRTGFAQAIAASSVAALGDGNEAVDFLNGLLDNDLGNTIHGSMVLPNTFYESTAGEPLVLRVADWTGPVVVQAERELEVTSRGNGEFAIDLRAGERVLLSPAAAPVDQAIVRPLPRAPSEAHPYGVRPDNRLTDDRTNPNDRPLRIDQ